jgi:hypothetical protein
MAINGGNELTQWTGQRQDDLLRLLWKLTPLKAALDAAARRI